MKGGGMSKRSYVTGQTRISCLRSPETQKAPEWELCEISFCTMRLNGEPARVRTVDLLIKSQLLYQLSYGSWA